MAAFKANRNTKAVVRIFLLFIFAAMIRYIWTALTAIPYAMNVAKALGDKFDSTMLGQMMSTDPKFYLLMSLYNILIAILVLSFWRRLDHRKLSDMGLDWTAGRWKELLLGCAAAIIIIGASVSITLTVGSIWPVARGSVSFGMDQVIQTLLYAIFICGFTVFGEEVLYRGYIQSSAMTFSHPTTAVYVSALIFMMSRFGVFNNALGILEVFLLGLILGYAYLLSGSLYLTIGFRFAWDYLKIYTFRFQDEIGFKGPVWQVFGNDGIVMMKNLSAGTRLQLVFIIVELLIALGLYMLCKKKGILLHKEEWA